MVYREKYRGNTLNDINKIIQGKLTPNDFTRKSKDEPTMTTNNNNNNFVQQTPITQPTNNFSEPKHESQPQAQYSNFVPQPTTNNNEDKKKGIFGFIKDISKKMGKDKAQEEVYINPIFNKTDAIERLERMQNKYRGKMSDSDYKEFSMALSYLKDNV